MSDPNNGIRNVLMIACVVVAIACLASLYGAIETTGTLFERNEVLLTENAQLRKQVAILTDTRPPVKLLRNLNSGDVQVLVGDRLYLFRGVCIPQKRL